MTAESARAKCVLIAAGGTGGHVIPGVEVAKELRDRGWECVFVGTARGFENRLVPEAGFALRHVPIGSLKRVSIRRRLATLLSAPKALASAIRLVSQRRPAAALSLGGYAAGPVVAACGAARGTAGRAGAERNAGPGEPAGRPGGATSPAGPSACGLVLQRRNLPRDRNARAPGVLPGGFQTGRVPFHGLDPRRKPGRGTTEPRGHSTRFGSGGRAAAKSPC